MKKITIFKKAVTALAIDSADLPEILKAGDVEVTIDEINTFLAMDDATENIDDKYLAGFLNGYIVHRRGPSDKPQVAEFDVKHRRSIGNIVLKKLKIALSFTTEDMLDVFLEGDMELTKGELSPYFRKEGHKHYKYCTDEMLEAFFLGLRTCL
jgi:uncharacterized protein YehS (DUF1456 family)